MVPMQPANFPVPRLRVPYSSLSPLNTLDIHLPRDPESAGVDEKYWIVYIHGGAWRDPLLTSASIIPTLSYLSPSTLPIAGVASLNYRLSAYVSHPTHPSDPNDLSRNVKHPAHVKDVLTAIEWLQREYEFDSRYVLVGHSCGATLALQAITDTWKKGSEGTIDFKKPSAVIGIEGIYNMRLLDVNHKEIPLYHQFLVDAFGDDQNKWDKASPSNGVYSKGWLDKNVLIIAHSKEDELVEWAQVDAIAKSLQKDHDIAPENIMLELKGKHHEVWQDGRELARAIRVAFSRLL